MGVQTVNKYKMLVKDKQTVMAPEGTHWFNAAEQQGFPYVWGRGDLSKPLVDHTVFMVANEDEVPDNTVYIGSCTSGGQSLVWHVWVPVPPPTEP